MFCMGIIPSFIMKLIQAHNIGTLYLIKNHVVFYNNCFCKNTLFIIWIFVQTLKYVE